MPMSLPTPAPPSNPDDPTRGRVAMPRVQRIKRWLPLLELLLILAVGYAYAHSPLLDFNNTHLQQTYEHNEQATLHVLAGISLRDYGTIPLWNPYMVSGFPFAGDFILSFWNPVSTLPVLLWGGVNGYKIAAFLSFLVAGVGQWLLGYLLRLRPAFRVWSALLFMLSGGLALFWHLGWHQLLLGVVWFPWAFAGLIYALRHHSRSSLVLAALANVMVLTSAGGYYYFYLGGSLGVLTLLLLLLTAAEERALQLRRALAIALLTAGLLAVVVLPSIDVYRFTSREASPDPRQYSSQPIHYALFQYVVSDPRWRMEGVLEQASGYTWFYVGVLPVAGLFFVPLAFSKARRRRERDALIILTTLTVLFLAWHANRHTIVGWLYEAFPVLYTFRFPGRLLVPATSPLVALGAWGLQTLWFSLRRTTRNIWFRGQLQLGQREWKIRLQLKQSLTLLLLLLLGSSAWNVYQVNQPFAFTTNQARDEIAPAAISWLQAYDPGLYYISAGDWRVWWWWTTTAYELEQPMLNFLYNRYLNGYPEQRREDAIVRAEAKYRFPWSDDLPEGSTLIREWGGVQLYEVPEVLPYAFAVDPSRLTGDVPLTASEVEELEAQWLNPNQLEIHATATEAGQQLVALVSTFPGWKVYVDGQEVPLVTVNDYLGVRMLEGTHSYRFSYEPPLFFVGLLISVASLIVALGVLLAEWLSRWHIRATRYSQPPADSSKRSTA